MFFGNASSLSKHRYVGQTNPPSSGDGPCHYGILPHSHVDGWEILGLSGGFQVLWGGKGTHPSLPGDSIPLRAVRKRQAKCGCHSWAPAPVRTQRSCVLPPFPQPSCVSAVSQRHHRGNVWLHWKDILLLSQELLEQLRAVLQKVEDIW